MLTLVDGDTNWVSPWGSLLTAVDTVKIPTLPTSRQRGSGRRPAIQSRDETDGNDGKEEDDDEVACGSNTEGTQNSRTNEGPKRWPTKDAPCKS